MMKITIEQELEEHEYIGTVLNKFRGDEWAMAISEYYNKLRNVWKYSENEKEVEMAERFKDELTSILAELELNCD